MMIQSAEQVCSYPTNMSVKGTNVRSNNLPSEPAKPRMLPQDVSTWSLRLRALRFGLANFGPLAPELAARAAEQLMLRARRVPRPAWETALLAGARSFRVPFSSLGPRGLAGLSWGNPVNRTVVLAHGWEGRGTQLGAFIAPLVAAGFHVVATDAPGHGDSDGRLTSIVDFAEGLDRVLDHVGPVFGLVTHSLGGGAAVLALSRRMFAPRSVFVAPPTDGGRFTREFSRIFGFNQTMEWALQRRLESRYGISFDAVSIPKLATSIGRDAPLLVIHDEDDRDVPIADGQLLARTWPSASFHRTRGLGHRRILKDPDVIGRTVSFLSA